MRLFHLLAGFVVVSCFPLVGCGGSDEPITISTDELNQYVNENADQIAEDARIEAEEESEEAAEENEEDE